jgi:hypothetical protein
MAKEFGMNLTDKDGEMLVVINLHREYLGKYDMVWYAYGRLCHSEFMYYEKAYIHPNSLSILKPQPSDIYLHGSGFQPIYRDGKHFFWPKCEELEDDCI